jgi:putative hydrolase of the HAD superfamily
MTTGIVFDLFGTLTGSEYLRARQVEDLARLLGVVPETMSKELAATYDERARGLFGDVREQIINLAGRIGVTPSNEGVELAVQLRLDGQRELLQPRVGAIQVLGSLRQRGLMIGVLSDCTPEVPLLWDQSPFADLVDGAVFSCVFRSRKPDPRMYAEVLSVIGASATDCLYVGDGGSSELPGAVAVGLRAILLAVPGEHSSKFYEDIAWHGTAISSLEEMFAFVD